jgi:hypothetical protein
MNLLEVCDEYGRVIRADLIDGTSVTDIDLAHGGTVTIMPMPGYQLNGHRWDCRCRACRPDIACLS